MNDTQKRIEKYKGLLPHLKEKVAAVSILLAMSATMLTTVSFAWLALSRSPEVTDVMTSIASNGNLEIALVGAEGNIPLVSAVGDSNKNLIERNITWGNLINLSDPAYGLDNLILRPAQLNTQASSLLTNPLYGAEYDQDGRVLKLNSNFGYATWVPPEGDKPGYFKISNDKGVRAISSIKVEAVGAELVFTNMVTGSKDKNLMAANSYIALGQNSKYMQSLATMMGLYMTARMNPDNATLSNPECDIADIQNLRDMYEAFLYCFDAEAEAMAALVNLQLFLAFGENNYVAWTQNDIYEATDAELKALTAGKVNEQGNALPVIKLSQLEQFQKDRNTVASDLEKLNEICSSGANLKWTDSGLNAVVNNLVDVGKCTIGADNTPISSIGASNAMGYLSGTQEARITNGILYRFEERTGGYIDVRNLSISATVNRMGMTIPATVRANIQTTAPRNYCLFTNDQQYAESQNTGNYQGGIPIANDTYGLAVDLWVRTNAAGSYLTLQGNVLVETHEEQAMGKDASGKDVKLYTLTRQFTGEDGSTENYTIDVYQVVGEDNSITWHDADNHAVLTEEELGGVTPIAKMVEVETVIGYEGENRVWDGSAGLSVNSTTQGSGSCYVYYADTPEDQARSLKLLAAMKIAFVDENGKLLAQAEMDTKHFYANNGKVIVPLVLGSDSKVIGTDVNGEPIYAITALEKNVATRITAIVYLDGTQLTNEDVLSSADIQGKLNIQFGSTANLNAMENEKLSTEERHVSAALVGKTSFKYDEASEANPMKVGVEVIVDGTEPKTVTAFFIRAINATQGSREETMTFTYNASSGKWESSYTFQSPGNYILRNVQVDGVDYDLDNETLPTVTVEGFTVTSLGWNLSSSDSNYAKLMTASNSASANLTLKFASNDVKKMPQSVTGRFIHKADGSVANVKFTYDPTTFQWTGTATFLKSGEYNLQYLVLDGEYSELSADLQKTVEISLGMKVEVYTESPTSFKYLPGDKEWSDNKQNLYMKVKILDDSDAEIQNLTDVKLYYRRRGSSAAGLDANLTWDASTGYYIGNFGSTVGIFEFSHVEATSGQTTSTIAKADRSPTFTIMSPEPPKYVANDYNAYQYAPGGNAWVEVTIEQSSTATVYAVFQNLRTGEEIKSAGVGTAQVDGSTTMDWRFDIPKDAAGKQDGNWQLLRVELADVYDSSGKLYTEDDPMVMELADQSIKTKVVQTITINFVENKSANFGANAQGTATGAFMQEYEISGLFVELKDFEGQPLKDIKNVKLKFTYGNNSETYGGYTSADLTNAVADFEITLSNDGSGIKFVQGTAVKIKYAGSYTTSLSFEIDSKPVSYEQNQLPSNVPKYTVSSVAPTVAITAATVYGGSYNSTSATVYYESYSGTCGVTNYRQPNVTMTLTGYGNATQATLTFTESNNGTVHLYTSSGGSSAVNSFSWTANGTCQRWIGRWQSQTGGDRKTPAGTLTATKLVLSQGNVNCEFDITDITINNPS